MAIGDIVSGEREVSRWCLERFGNNVRNGRLVHITALYGRVVRRLFGVNASELYDDRMAHFLHVSNIYRIISFLDSRDVGMRT